MKVKGKRAARIAATIMNQHTGIETRFYRGEENGGVYWVSNTYLQPLGEQEVLDRLPAGSLLYCSGCSHQLARLQRPSVPPGRGLSPHVKENLRQLAREICFTPGSAQNRETWS